MDNHNHNHNNIVVVKKEDDGSETIVHINGSEVVSDEPNFILGTLTVNETELRINPDTAYESDHVETDEEDEEDDDDDEDEDDDDEDVVEFFTVCTSPKKDGFDESYISFYCHPDLFTNPNQLLSIVQTYLSKQ